MTLGIAFLRKEALFVTSSPPINDTAKHLVFHFEFKYFSCQVVVRFNWANVSGQVLLLQTGASPLIYALNTPQTFMLVYAHSKNTQRGNENYKREVTQV